MHQKKLSVVALIVIVLATSVGIVIGGVVYNRFIRQGESFDDVLKQVSEELNQTCPYSIDSETLLDNTFAGPGLMLTYMYTLINVTADQVDTEFFQSQMKPQITAIISTDPSMELFRENEVTFVYKYRDKNKIFICEIIITPEDYMGKKYL